MHGSVALLDGPRLLAESVLPTDRRSAQTLAPALVDLMAAQQLTARQVGLVATTVGPGSFTGLRVGITASKTFAYAAGAEVIGVNTLEVIACQSPSEEVTEIQAVLDAQRKELFVGRFAPAQEGAKLKGTKDEQDAFEVSRSLAIPELHTIESGRPIVPVDEWLKELRPGIAVIGPGLTKIVGQIPTGISIAPQGRWEPRASVVGQLAWREYERGRRDDLWKLAPLYLRPSYAEEKAQRKGPT